MSSYLLLRVQLFDAIRKETVACNASILITTKLYWSATQQPIYKPWILIAICYIDLM